MTVMVMSMKSSWIKSPNACMQGKCQRAKISRPIQIDARMDHNALVLKSLRLPSYLGAGYKLPLGPILSVEAARLVMLAG